MKPQKENTMKKNANSEINFATNTIIVTKKFREAAGIIGSPEFNTMVELRILNMPITERIIKRTSGEDRWTFARMAAYYNGNRRHNRVFRFMRNDRAFVHRETDWERNRRKSWLAEEMIDELPFILRGSLERYGRGGLGTV